MLSTADPAVFTLSVEEVPCILSAGKYTYHLFAPSNSTLHASTLLHPPSSVGHAPLLPQPLGFQIIRRICWCSVYSIQDA